jgi:hypothetical protein
MRDSNERVYLRTNHNRLLGSISLHGSYTYSGGSVMHRPVLLGSTLTDDEFKHLCNLAQFIECPTKNTSYFWISSDLSIGCNDKHPHQDFSNRNVLTMDEFLAYIEQQKLLWTLQ